MGSNLINVSLQGNGLFSFREGTSIDHHYNSLSKRGDLMLELSLMRRGPCTVVGQLRADLGCDSKMEPFVVGGVYATIWDYPHCIYLAIDCSMPWICGASVLNQNIIITAAHCVDGCDSSNEEHLIEAYAGHEDLVKVKAKREIAKIKTHENYDEHTAANDIALASLKKSLYLGQNIKRVLINPRFPDVQKGVVAGWGIVNEELEDTATYLKSVEQKIRSERVCARIGTLDPGMFCAGSTKDDTHHPADGDSGSALISKDFTQLGLVSFRSRRLPALMVYTNISYYYKWIKKNANKLYCLPKTHKGT